MRNKLKIGCHLSASDGYLAMGKEAVAMNADTFAFFTRNPRGGAAKEIKQADIEIQTVCDRGFFCLFGGVNKKRFRIDYSAFAENLGSDIIADLIGIVGK